MKKADVRNECLRGVELWLDLSYEARDKASAALCIDSISSYGKEDERYFAMALAVYLTAQNLDIDLSNEFPELAKGGKTNAQDIKR